ncbi:MAG TPA: zinc-ribbon domain-containing protein [Polyangiaceae bacterium]
MKVSCQACGAKYTIADDKVRGRKVKIRCKSCGAPIVVDAQSEAPPAAEAPNAAAPADAAGTGAAKSDSWSVNLSDTDQRTLTTEEIVAGWQSGVVTSDAFVWKDGMSDWVAILECAEIAALLPAASAADPSATPFGPTIVTAPSAEAPAKKGLPAARISGGRTRGGVDLFDAVEGGAPEEDVATSAPAFPGMAGTTPYDDGKMTGARNENSVLFSLDALKGGLTAEPARKTQPPRSAPVASDPLVASPAGLGGGSPLFSLSADQALLTAPAPPDPPPRPVETGERSAGPNKLVVYGGATAAAVALLGLGLLLGRSGKEEPPKDTDRESATAASAAPEKKETKDAKEEKKEEEKKTEEAKPEASASAAPSASASDKKVAVSSGKTTPSTGSPTTTKEPKKEEAPAAGTAPFSVSAAQVALTQAATNAGACKKPDGPTGSGKVQVTFATSGRVTSATVGGPPFAGTPVGGCVAGVFRKAKVPPFAGNPVTVSKSFSVK